MLLLAAALVAVAVGRGPALVAVLRPADMDMARGLVRCKKRASSVSENLREE